MDGCVTNIELDAMQNEDYRRVLFTSRNSQLVLMTLQPHEEIGLETHDGHDQFIRVESGNGLVELDGERFAVHDGFAVLIPAGTKHNVVNTSAADALHLYTLYSPPVHPDGTVHHTKADEGAHARH